MATVTLTSKGQLTIPRQLREALGLAPGARLQASIDRHGRLILVPARYEPQDLFSHRPMVDRVLTVEEMDQAFLEANADGGVYLPDVVLAAITIGELRRGVELIRHRGDAQHRRLRRLRGAVAEPISEPLVGPSA